MLPCSQFNGRQALILLYAPYHRFQIKPLRLIRPLEDRYTRGYLNCKSDPPPRATVIRRSFLLLHEIAEMFHILGPHP